MRRFSHSAQLLKRAVRRWSTLLLQISWTWARAAGGLVNLAGGEMNGDCNDIDGLLEV